MLDKKHSSTSKDTLKVTSWNEVRTGCPNKFSNSEYNTFCCTNENVAFIMLHTTYHWPT